jgi:hypothetical protein
MKQTIMNSRIQILSPPIFLAGRELYLVVRVFVWTDPEGGILAVEPCALFIREDLSWFFVSFNNEISDIDILLSVLNRQES